MVQIDINKLIADFLNDKEDIGNQIQRAARNTVKQMLHHALQKQGLRIKDGEIVAITTEEVRNNIIRKENGNK